MGGCFSDVRGGKQAVGSGGGGGPTAPPQEELNDAVDFYLRSKGYGGFCSQIELSLSASKLCDRDILSKSDPMAVVYAKKQNGSLMELGRTEVIMNSLSPTWIEKITVNYQFEITQPLIFQIYDVDTHHHNIPVKTLKLNEQEFLGEASCLLSEIVMKNDRTLTLNLQGSNKLKGVKLGTITVHAEETVSSRTVVEMTLRCSNLVNKDLFSESDPFLRISRVVETGAFIPLCKTEVVDNNLNPTWKPITLSGPKFVNKDNPLVIECFDFDSDGNHELLGKVQVSVNTLKDLNKEKRGVNLFASSSGSHEHTKILKSQLYVERFSEKLHYSFLDYISGGFELSFMVAVDFTASNGDPRSPKSLHYIDRSGCYNSYQQAIREVGEVIQFYDADKHFSAWGFGGRLLDGELSHCFNLNGSYEECEVVGVEGIMTSYAAALHKVSLAGPTLFGPVITKAASIASQSLHYTKKKYFVLLIITDGVITDLQETKDAIVMASDLPLSILIVGVGAANFDAMEILDADNRRLESSTGRVATRDIVQFVAMRDMQGQQISIAQSLLEELPGQFLTYMRSRDIEPEFAQHAATSMNRPG